MSNTRNKLYLANFALLNVEPLISATLNIKPEISETALRGLLSICKQWYIKNIYLRPYKSGYSLFFDFLQKVLDNQYLFEKNEFQFSLMIDEIPLKLFYEKLSQTPDANDPFFVPLLIHTADYEIVRQEWGLEFVRFYGKKPEVYSVRVVKNNAVLSLRNAKHICAIFALENAEPVSSLLELENVTQFLNPLTGKFSMQIKKSKSLKLFVLRQIDGIINQKLYVAGNVFSQNYWWEYLKYVSTEYEKIIPLIEKLILKPFFPQENQPVVPLFPNLIDRFTKETATDFFQNALCLWHDFDSSTKKIRQTFHTIQLSELQNIITSDLFQPKIPRTFEIELLTDEPGINDSYANGSHGQSTIIQKHLQGMITKLNSNNIFPGSHYCEMKTVSLKLLS